MGYDETEKILKKIAGVVKEFPPEIREKAYDALFAALLEDDEGDLSKGLGGKEIEVKVNAAIEKKRVFL